MSERSKPLFEINQRVIYENCTMIIISRFRDVKTAEWMYLLATCGTPIKESQLTPVKPSGKGSWH